MGDMNLQHASGLQTASNEGGYFGVPPHSERVGSADRYPDNHVRYVAFLRMMGWSAGLARGLGARPFGIAKVALKQFDRAAPFASHQGTKAELEEARSLLQTQCEGLDQNPYLSEIGRFLLRRMVSEKLAVRTQVLKNWHENHAQIEIDGKVERPILITGAYRSGSTLLHRLLAEDPGARAPYTFELEAPLPPLQGDADPLQDPRIEKSGAALHTLRTLAPGFLEKFAESHYLSPTEREECFIFMLAHNGLSAMNAPQAGAKFGQLFLSPKGKRALLRYERLLLSTLAASSPPKSHFALKAPNYAPYFSLLFDEYPDARVVVTHRTPLATVPSTCRMFESWNVTTQQDGTFDRHQMSAFVEPIVKACIDAPMDYRRAHPEREAQIFDCVYDELVADPLAMVRGIYDHFDIELLPEAQARMSAYLKDNKQGKHGRHKYSLEDYGFTRESIGKRYEEYMHRYGFAS